MLVAQHEGQRYEAANAQRGWNYICPECLSQVVFKRGRIVAAHFAHKPPVTCPWGIGESAQHMKAKSILAEEFRARGLRAEVEYMLPGLDMEDRRADIVVWTKRHRAYAFEIQHSSISLDDIYSRTNSYMAMHVPVAWIALARHNLFENATPTASGFHIERYSVRPWERWVHGYNFGTGIWYFDPVGGVFWKGTLTEHKISRELTTWLDGYGDEQTGGGNSYVSKRWRELYLEGPIALNNFTVRPEERKRAWSDRRGVFAYPAGEVATLDIRDRQAIAFRL